MIVSFLIAVLIAATVYALRRHRRIAVVIGVAGVAFGLIAGGFAILMYLGDRCPGCATVRTDKH